MSSPIDFSIVIPAYNEDETLENFIKELKNALEGVKTIYEIIVVDDGSTDNTYAIANKLQGIKLLRHPYNKGNGAAVKSGIFEAKGEIIIVIDSDGQHDPVHIPHMLGLLKNYDLVVGARDSFGMNRRGFGNRLVSKLATYLSGIHVPDLTSGFRAFKKEKMLEFIDLLPNGFSLPSTSTLAFATSGYNVTFIPIHADRRKGGKSSINVSRDGFKFLVLIVRMISLFKPLKIFAPTSIVLFVLSVLWSVRTIIYYKGLSSTVVMLFLAAVFTFLFGLVADQIAETRLSLGKMHKHMAKNKKTID